MKFNVVCILLVFAVSSCTHSKLDLKDINHQLHLFMTDPESVYIPAEGFISNGAIAVKVAEPVLFSIYGEDNILRQKPYQVNLIDSLWVINGTLPVFSAGGCFFIVINKRDGKILGVTHGK